MDDELSCPKCNGELAEKTVGETIAVHQCSKCYGILVPAGLTKKLNEAWSPEHDIDVGSDKLGKKYNAIDDINCPKCKIKMDKIQDQEQPHIWMENCAACGATFYDAGELTDLREKTLSDIFKSLFRGKRE